MKIFKTIQNTANKCQGKSFTEDQRHGNMEQTHSNQMGGGIKVERRGKNMYE